jgi:hypothetical protein
MFAPAGFVAVQPTMRKRMRSAREDEFNTPEEMLRRAAFLIYLGGLTAGLVVAGVAWVARNGALEIAGGLSFLAGVGAREWLRLNGGLAGPADALEKAIAAEPPAEPVSCARLVELLQEWNALEQRRGSSDFDPWALQATRNEIHALIAADPALDRLFRVDDRAA